MASHITIKLNGFLINFNGWWDDKKLSFAFLSSFDISFVMLTKKKKELSRFMSSLQASFFLNCHEFLF